MLNSQAVRLFSRVRTKGLGGTCRAVADRVEEWALEPYFERHLGIATTGAVLHAALGYQEVECAHYAPSAYGNIRRIMRALDIRPGKDVLLDYGSGKGRVAVVAALYPFACVRGVERSSALTDIARHNIERARPHLRCQRIELVTGDAASYAVPDDVTIVYFASPFGGAILDAVLARLTASLTAAPRRLLVVSHGYDSGNPFERQLRQCGWLTLQSQVRLQRSNHAWIYTNDSAPD